MDNSNSTANAHRFLSPEQVRAAKANGWSDANIRSWGSVSDPTFVEPEDLPWTERISL